MTNNPQPLFRTLVESDFAAVNQLIVEKLRSEVGLVENIGQYIVDGGGKRLRPLLVLLLTKALGYRGQQHLDLAAIIEFIHTATLLHDDVVDVSELRRGRPTANARWGNAPSVLVGDFLYSRAFQMMVAIGNMEIMAILSDTTNTISEGEVQQLVNAKDPRVTEQNYMNVIHKKTAALFEAACETGAVLAGVAADVRAGARQYGFHLGLAFQLTDDALDYTGDVSALGKNVGDDLAEGKPTLPLIYSMARCNGDENTLIAEALNDGGITKLEQIIDIVRRRGGIDYTRSVAEHHARQAHEALAAIPPGEFKAALADLAIFAVERSY